MTRRTPDQYDWAKALFNDRRLPAGPNQHFTSPRRSKISHVTLHHMTIVAKGSGSDTTSALEGAYATWTGSRQASANYGVSGNQVWQYVSDNDAAWSDANSTSNHSTLSIEHANSTGSPSWEISDETMATGQHLVASLHLLYGLGRPSRKTVKVHQDYYATSCPGPYMMAHLDDYIAEAGRKYDAMKTGKPVAPAPKPDPTPAPAPVIKDKMDPAQYFVGAKGDHITWLGERLVIWAKALGLSAPYKVGPAPSFTTTDQKAVAAFQRAQGWRGKDADGLPGAQSLKILASGPTPLQRIVTWNLKSPTLISKWLGWVLRRNGQVALVKEMAPTVLLVQEAGSPSYVKWYDKAFGAVGLTNVEAYNHAGSGKWRAIWFDKREFTRKMADLYTMSKSTWYKGDDKYMAECVLLDRADEPWYFGSFHLENDSPADSQRVAQIKDCFRHALTVAKTYGVAPEHVILGGDSNSRDMVRNWVEENTDYRDAAGLAKTASRVGVKSINNWKPFAAGSREDYLFVHKSVAVATFDQRDGHKVSDHNPQIITF